MSAAPTPADGSGIDTGLRPNTDSDQFLTFMLGGEEYGLDILRVRGIQGWDRVTPIPSTPDYVLGVINLRGTVVPIVDLRRRFELPAVEFGPTTVVIVVRVESPEAERTVGIVVDAVSEVYNVAERQMKPPPDFGAAIDTDFVRGLATLEDKMVILLDVDRLINAGILESAAGGVAA